VIVEVVVVIVEVLVVIVEVVIVYFLLQYCNKSFSIQFLSLLLQYYRRSIYSASYHIVIALCPTGPIKAQKKIGAQVHTKLKIKKVKRRHLLFPCD